MKISTIIIFLIFLWSGEAYSVDRYKGLELPDVIDVQKMALDYARLRPEELSDLKKRSKMAALLPTFQVDTTASYINKVNVNVRDNVSVTSSGTEIGPTTSEATQNNDNNAVFEVKAVWALNEIIYNKNMIDIAQEARYQMRERRLLTSEVNKLYFELKRLLQLPKEDPNRGRIEEVVAELDSLTGGKFSESVGIRS